MPHGWSPPPSLTRNQGDTAWYALNEVQERNEPATAGEISTELMKLAMQMAVAERSEAEWQVLAEAYCEDLDGIPLEIIKATCREWRQNKTFFPLISEFLGIARPIWKGWQEQERRLKILAWVFKNPTDEITRAWYDRAMAAGQPQKQNKAMDEVQKLVEQLT